MDDWLFENGSTLFAILAIVVAAIGKILWRRSWKIDIIAKDDRYEEHKETIVDTKELAEETRDIVDDHTVEIAVSNEKHHSHERRLDRVESNRTKSGGQ